METIYPKEAGFSGFYGVGFRKNPSMVSTTQRVGTVVMKRTYTINGDLLQPDSGGEGVRLGDVTSDHTIGGTPVKIVTRESDIAPYKPEADLIVLGFYQNGYWDEDGNWKDFGNGGEVMLRNETTLVEQLWLQREQNSDMSGDPDTQTNLFGWEQRALSPDRSADAGTFSSKEEDYPSLWPVPAGQTMRDPLHAAGFNNRFYNAYRRSWKRLAGNFPYFSGRHRITVKRTWPGNSATVQFILPDEQLNARFYYYCGHGPDRDSRWCEQELSLVKDTVVAEPDSQRVYVLWRGVWDFDAWPIDRYRRLTVKLES
jgi:hypothetical protein